MKLSDIADKFPAISQVYVVAARGDGCFDQSGLALLKWSGGVNHYMTLQFFQAIRVGLVAVKRQNFAAIIQLLIENTKPLSIPGSEYQLDTGFFNQLYSQAPTKYTAGPNQQNPQFFQRVS